MRCTESCSCGIWGTAVFDGDSSVMAFERGYTESKFYDSTLCLHVLIYALTPPGSRVSIARKSPFLSFNLRGRLFSPDGRLLLISRAPVLPGGRKSESGHA